MAPRLIVVSLLVAVLVAASAAIAAPSRAANSGGIGIRLLDATAQRPNDPLARPYIVDRLAPGTSIQRRIAISNSTDLGADVAVYAAAARLRRDTFEFAPGRTRNDLSTWISTSRAAVRLPAGSDEVETLTISVPAGASSGEHYAVIWAEVSSPAPATGGVTRVNRVGIRVYISIGPRDTIGSNFGISRLAAQRSPSGQPLVVATVRNTGRRTLEIGGHLTLSNGPGGLRAGPFPVRFVGLLAPAQSERATVRLDRQLPRGPWRARLVLSSGSLRRHTEATITFPQITSADSQRRKQFVVAVLVLLTFAATAYLFSRRRGDGKSAAVFAG